MHRLIFFLVAAWVTGFAHAVEVGDDREAVIAELGHPIGEIQLGDKTRLLFKVGDVTFIDGKVSGHAIKSVAQLDRENEIRQERRADWANLQAERQARAIAQGRAWLKRMEEKPEAITNAQAERIVAHWETVQREFSGADVAAEYEATLAVLRAQAERLSKQREAKRFAELEERIALAEQQAAQAQREAFEARQQSFLNQQGYRNPYIYSAPRSVVVIENGGYTKYPGHGCAYQSGHYSKPILRATLNTGNFNFHYRSGGSNGTTGAYARPIIVSR